jgi:hypothetical protein
MKYTGLELTANFAAMTKAEKSKSVSTALLIKLMRKCM